MDVENRQQCQLMSELQHRPGPSMRVRVAAVALQQTPSPWFLQHMRHVDQALTRTYEQQRELYERWQRRTNPEGVEFDPSRPGRHA